MEKIELIQNAISANGFVSTDTEAGYINPEYWNRKVLEYEKANLVVVQFAKVYDDLLGDGDSMNVSIKNAPTAAAAVAESADATISVYAPGTVVFTPTEYTKAYQLSDKERKRAFFSVMDDMASDIGYALALAKDTNAVSVLQAGAGNAVVADGVASSALASSNQLDHLDLIDAMKLNAIDKYVNHVALIVNPQQMTAVMKDSTFLAADKFGSEAAVFNGFIGKLFGIPVYMTTQIPVSDNVSKALLISSKDAFGICSKKFEGIRNQRQELGRYTTIIGTIDFDIEVLQANSICTIETWAA